MLLFPILRLALFVLITRVFFLFFMIHRTRMIQLRSLGLCSHQPDPCRHRTGPETPCKPRGHRDITVYLLSDFGLRNRSHVEESGAYVCTSSSHLLKVAPFFIVKVVMVAKRHWYLYFSDICIYKKMTSQGPKTH